MESPEQPAEVLERFTAGEREAFEILFRQFQGEVYGWIVRIVRDPAIAEDLTIETFWRIHRAHARFDPSRSFAAWARRVASNVALDYLKSGQARERESTAQVDVEDIRPEEAMNPAIRRELRERTSLAFRQLPSKLRVVATLALIEEQPHRDIADALNLSTAAVKARVFRAVQLLRRKLGNLEVNHE